MPRLLCILSLLALIWGLDNNRLKAAPLLQVHDRLDIEMDPVRRLDDQALVRGRVVERASGEGSAYQEVNLRIDDYEATVLTDGAGYFSSLFRIDQGTHLLSVDVSGSPSLDASHFEMADFNIAKSPLALSLDAPSELADTAGELQLRVSARSDSAGAVVEVSAYYGAAGGEMALIGAATTDSDGAATITIARANLGSPGRKRIEIRVAGNRNYDAARAAANLNITGSSVLTLRSNHSRYDYGDNVLASGRLLNGRGEAIVGAVVGIDVNSQRIGNAKTDERGDFHLDVDSEELGSGTTAMQATYSPTESWNASSKSEPVKIIIAERKPVPLSYTLAAFALTSLALLSFVGMRTRPWERWLRKTDDKNNTETLPEEDSDLPPATGLAPARPKLTSTLRRAQYYDVEGRILDAITKEAIADADIEIVGATTSTTQSAEDGAFASETLADGDYKVQVRAFSYVSEGFSVRIPHRGELRGAVVHMLPVREKIFSMYKDAVRHLLPEAKLWGIWTPRQILQHVRESSSGERLSDLTDFVEESFFSARKPGEELLLVARQKIAALREEGPGARPRA